MTKATFLRIASQCCFECYANKRCHARYINRHVAFNLPSINLQLNVHVEKTEEGKLARFLCRSILLNAGMYVHFTAGKYCYILSAKKQATLLVQLTFHV